MMLKGLSARISRALQFRGQIAPTDKQDVAMIAGMTIAEPCQLLDHYDPALHPRNAIAEWKVNGIRAIATPARIVTRNALPFNAALHCRPVLDQIEKLYGCPMVFDGEYQEMEGFDATLSAFRKNRGSGIFHVFDAVPYSEWKTNRFTQKLRERKDRLKEAVNEIDHPMVHCLEDFAIGPDDVMPLAQHMWKSGMEGIVIKDANSLYHRGRSKTWLKVKNRITHDGTIIDVIIDSESKRAKSLMVRTADNKTTRVGSKIPEALRVAIGADPEAYTGRCVEFGATDTNDIGRPTGVYFVCLRADR